MKIFNVLENVCTMQIVHSALVTSDVMKVFYYEMTNEEKEMVIIDLGTLLSYMEHSFA